MIKSTLLFATLILLLASCSDDTLSDKLQGDNYSATFFCNRPMLSDLVPGVSIQSEEDDRFTITYNEEYGSMTGTIDENDDLTIDSFSASLANGITLNFTGGTGEFRIDSIVNTNTPIKVVEFLMNDDNGQACFLNLFEEV